MLACHGRDDEAKRLFLRAIQVDAGNRYIQRAYDEFLREIESDSRDPDECLRAAVAKDPKYAKGISRIKNRRM